MPKRKLPSILFSALMVLFLISSAGAQSAGPAAANPAVFIPWKDFVFDDNSQAEYLSAAYIGPLQFPVFSYVDSDAKIMLAYPKKILPLKCGPDDAWTCQPCTPTNADEETFSPIATATNPGDGSYITAWAFERNQPGAIEDHDIQVYVRDWSGELVDGGGHTEYLINLGHEMWANFTLKGRPSLVVDSEMGFHVALVAHNNSTGLDGLMYSFPSDADNDSCGYTSKQKCILIDGQHLDGNPVLVLDASGKPRITYYDTQADSLKFAYPQPNAALHPNCGPGGNTWRCISIYQEPDTDTILPKMSMAIGSSNPHIAFMVDVKNAVPEQVRRLYHAQFVGTGGNCGMDYAVTNSEPLEINLVPRWECTNRGDVAVGEAVMPYYSLSLQVDTMDYPVIAFARHYNDENKLWLVYPPERLGYAPELSWYGVMFNTNGAKYASLALSKNGPAMIVFKDDDLTYPDLGMRIQSYEIYLPSIMY